MLRRTLHKRFPRRSSFAVLLVALFVLAFDHAPTEEGAERTWGPGTPLHEVLRDLGKDAPLHAIDSLDTALVESGEELVKYGRTTWPDGSKSGRISKYFTCDDCHNLKKEDPDLSVSDPEARLNYAMEHDMPFLQGTTLFGVVNRDSWYNGDYVEKYGQLALDARDTLRNAIQLCATECSQGRKLNEREMEAMLHYFWSISLELRDLGIGMERIQTLEGLAKEDGRASQAIKALQSKYLSGSPATFLKPLPLEKRHMGRKGDPEKGRFIYENSCQHCHLPGKGITRYTLDKSILTFKELRKNFDNWSDRSIYQVLRYGIQPRKGYRPYMPHYTKERMSNGQIEDLASYIRKKAQGG